MRSARTGCAPSVVWLLTAHKSHLELLELEIDSVLTTRPLQVALFDQLLKPRNPPPPSRVRTQTADLQYRAWPRAICALFGDPDKVAECAKRAPDRLEAPRQLQVAIFEQLQTTLERLS